MRFNFGSIFLNSSKQVIRLNYLVLYCTWTWWDVFTCDEKQSGLEREINQGIKCIWKRICKIVPKAQKLSLSLFKRIFSSICCPLKWKRNYKNKLSNRENIKQSFKETECVKWSVRSSIQFGQYSVCCVWSWCQWGKMIRNRIYQLVFEYKVFSPYFILSNFICQNLWKFSHLITVMLQEPQQTDLNNEFNSVFSEIGNSERVSFNVNYVQVDRERLDQSFTNCEWKSKCSLRRTIEFSKLE